MTISNRPSCLPESVTQLVDRDDGAGLAEHLIPSFLDNEGTVSELIAMACKKNSIRCVSAILKLTNRLDTTTRDQISRAVGETGTAALVDALHEAGLRLSDVAFHAACANGRESLALHLAHSGYPEFAMNPRTLSSFEVFQVLFQRSKIHMSEPEGIAGLMDSGDRRIWQWTAALLTVRGNTFSAQEDLLVELGRSPNPLDQRLYAAVCAHDSVSQMTALAAVLSDAPVSDDPAVALLLQRTKGSDWASTLLSAGLSPQYTTRWGQTLTDIAWERCDYHAALIYHDAGSPFTHCQTRVANLGHGLDFVERVSPGPKTVQPRLWALATNADRVRALVEVYPTLLEETGIGGLTPLMAAAIRDDKGLILSTLIDLGADVAATDFRGDTALHHAARHLFLTDELVTTDVIRFLVQAGAEIEKTNSAGKTALDYAIAAKSACPHVAEGRPLLEAAARRQRLHRDLQVDPAAHSPRVRSALDVL